MTLCREPKTLKYAKLVKLPKLSTFPVIHILWTWDFKDFALYISKGPPDLYFRPTISEIDPLLDEKSLFVRVPGLSGAVGGMV
jgi:hypothetical protein